MKRRERKRKERKRKENKKIVIAILTIKEGKRPLRGNLQNFVDLIKTGDELGAKVFVMSVTDLKLQDKYWNGHYYDSEKKIWLTKSFPAPRVIYNRIPYRKFEQMPEVQRKIQECLNSKKHYLFNPFFFNKWNLFEWLSNDKLTRQYIPRTEKLAGISNLQSLLNTFSIVYLKPIRGKAGSGIMRIDKISEGADVKYRLIHYIHKKREADFFTSIHKLWNKLKELIGQREYILQQGIHLTRFKRRPFDLRMLIQKNGKGKWTVTGMGARVAGRRSITTHVPRGGSIDHPIRLLNLNFDKERTRKIIKQARKASIVLAQQIEQQSKQIMGEMSMDLGIDTKGNLWFFEANSKPMKFDEPHIRKKSLRRIIQYCTYLNSVR